MKHKLLKTSSVLVVVLLFGVVASPALAASVTQITQPTPPYVAGTTKIDISGLTNYSNYNSISDGTLTVSFSSPMNKRGPVPGGGWLTWSSPPWSETATPHVLFSNYANSVNLTLSQPVKTFGFELEPNQFISANYTVDFIIMSKSKIVGSMKIEINGYYGARLVAVSVKGGSFDQINIVGDPAQGFAIAQVRYNISSTIPPGWGKGNKNGWAGSTPPGLDKKGKTPSGFGNGNKNGW